MLSRTVELKTSLQDERWIRELEAWWALSGPYDRGRAQSYWKVIMRDEFHDVLPGSAIKEVYDEVYRELSSLISELRASAPSSSPTP